jgi:thioredoxin reductase
LKPSSGGVTNWKGRSNSESAPVFHDRRGQIQHGLKVAQGDDAGFIKTGTDLSREDLDRAKWPLARPPYLLETSLPGVFAVGDVRGGNVKRVASAVGEGSIAVSFVHQVLAE